MDHTLKSSSFATNTLAQTGLRSLHDAVSPTLTRLQEDSPKTLGSFATNTLARNGPGGLRSIFYQPQGRSTAA